MSSLSDLGVKKNWTYETVITCFNGILPHAAPFGIKSPDNKSIHLEIYKDSKTLEYIMNKKEFAINFIQDSECFFYSLYNQRKIKFSNASKIKAPVIFDCPAFIEAKIKKSKKSFRSYFIDAEIIHIYIDNPPALINRAENLVIESLITASGINHLPEGKAEKILRENLSIIKKVAPDSKHVEMMLKLFEKTGLPIK